MIYSFFVISFGFAIIETMGAQIAGDQFGMDVSASFWIFTAGGIANVFTFALLLLSRDTSSAPANPPSINTPPPKKRFFRRVKITDKQMMFTALIVSMVGMLVLVDWQSFIGPSDPCQKYTCSTDYVLECESKLNTTMVPCMEAKHDKCIWDQNGVYGPCSHCPFICHSPDHTLSIYQTYIGFMFVNLAFPLGRIGSTAMYTKMLDPVQEVVGASKKNGFMLGVLNAGGCVARIVGPLLAEATYVVANHRTYIMSIMLAAVFGSAALLLVVLWKRLDPVKHKEELRSKMMMKSIT